MRINKIIQLVLAFVFISGVIGCDGADARKEKYLSKGHDYFEQGDFNKAKVEYKNVLQIDPKSVEGHYYMAKLNESLKQYKKALGGYNKAIELKPDHKESLAGSARIYLWAGMLDKALEFSDKALVIDASYSDALVVRAGAKLRQSDIEGALKDVRTSLDLDPDHIGSLALLTRTYVTQNQLEKAEALLVSAYKRQPENKSLISLLVQLFNDQKNYEKAIEYMEKLVQINRENFSYRDQLAYFHDVQGNNQKSEDILRKAIADFPDNIEPKRRLITYLANKRDLMFAQLELSRLIKDDEKNPELKLISATLYLQSKETEEAEKIYRDIIFKYGNEAAAVKAHYELIRVLLSTSRRDEAKTELENLLKNNAKHFDGLILRGALALEDKDARTAISDFRAALNEQPQSVRLIKMLGNAYIQIGELDLAQEQMMKATKLSPNDIQARLTYATILHEKKAYSDAIAHLNIVRQLEPENVQATQLLFKAYLVQGNYAQCIALAKQLEEQLPDSSLGYFYHGLVLQAQNKYESAMQQFDLALEKEPKAIEPLSSYVRSALASKKPEKAEAKLKSMVKAMPEYAIAQNLLGEVYAQQKKNKLALDAFKQASEKNPEWWIPYRNLASVQILMKQMDNAIETFKRGVAQAKNNVNLAMQLAALYEKQGKIDSALGIYEDMLKQQPESLSAANNLALLLVEHKSDQPSKDRALSLVDQFQTTNNASYMDTLGWVHYKRADYEKALSALLQADGLAPQSTLIYYHLGSVYFKKGDVESARKYLESAVNSKQSFTGKKEAQRMLAELQNPGSNT